MGIAEVSRGKKKIDGLLAGDREVTKLVLRTLLSPSIKTEVDGYPRTKTQVECLKLFHNRLSELRSKYLGTPGGNSISCRVFI